MPKRINNISVGNSGEYFVAAELERRGWTAAVPMSNTENFDILAINRDNGKQIAIQVKTTHSKNKKWMLSQKNETLSSPTIKYIFVSLNEYDNPSYHIVPSETVANIITFSHKQWLSTPGKRGQKHNDNPRRIFLDESDEFLNKWELLLQ